MTRLSSLIQRCRPLLQPDHAAGLTYSLFIRSLGGIYGVAFLIIIHQFLPLLGEEGLRPVSLFVDRLSAHFGDIGSVLWHYPSVFLFVHSDAILFYSAFIGLGLSLMMVLGYYNGLVLAFIWVLYLSYVHVGQNFYSFGWESILLEVGFFACFCCPLLSFNRAPPPRLMRYILLWITFRIYVGAGLIKLKGDDCWRSLTCLNYHFETQPVPHVWSRFFHQLPEWVLKTGVLVNHWVELIVPFGFFMRRSLRAWAGLMAIGFQVFLILSGNLSFLNWLTIVCCLPCFDNRHWERILPWSIKPSIQTRHWNRYLYAGLLILVMALSIQPTLNLFQKHQAMNRSYNPFHIVNTYGAFGSVSRERYELIIEGTMDTLITDKTSWLPYVFKAKPGPLDQPTPFFSPYHYRLDWQIWFAAMSTYQQHPWIVHMVYQLLTNNEGLLSLLKESPFQNGPPTYIRISRYRYRFAILKDTYWEREFSDVYLPPLHLLDRSLHDYLRHHGWSINQ